jgi:hypothetical protein
MNLDPTGEFGAQVWTLIPSGNANPFIHQQGWSLFVQTRLEKRTGKQRDFTPRGQSLPWGHISPLGPKL